MTGHPIKTTLAINRDWTRAIVGPIVRILFEDRSVWWVYQGNDGAPVMALIEHLSPEQLEKELSADAASAKEGQDE